MQINIAKVYNAGAGKKYGSVHDASGAKYLLPAGMAGVFQAGQVVDVPIKVENWDDRDNPGQKKPVHIINGRPGAAGAGVVAQSAPVAAPAGPGLVSAAVNQPTNNGYISEREKQGYILTSVLIKILADGQNASGKPVDTQDLPLLAEAAVATVRDKIIGKF